MNRKERELFEVIKNELYTPVVGDILDGMGFCHQFLPAGISPIDTKDKVVGYGMPVLMIDVYGPQKKPFGLLTEALDQLEEGDVYLASGGENRCAYWGELLTATAKKRGAAGAVINGYYRDSCQVMGQNFPVFSKGRYAQDSSVRTQVANYRCNMEIGGVLVHPGDLVFGDADGVLVIPREHIDEVIGKSLEKARGEKLVRKAIEEGMSSTEAFATFGIL